MSTPLSAALEYAENGWQVFPCYEFKDGKCACSKGKNCENAAKHPRTMNGVKDATNDPEQIHRWWTTFVDANIGLAAGEDSGIFVIDIDPEKGGFDSIERWEEARPEGPLPPTRTSMSGGGGRHLIFKYPSEIKIGNRVGWLDGVDVRSTGGYIIVPPSTHASGAKYRWINELSVADAPADLLHAVTSRKGGKGEHDLSDLPPTADILKGIPEGQRDDTLFRAACKWRRQLKDRAAVQTLVLEAARNCDPPFPEDQALQKIEQAFKQDHSKSIFDDDDEVELPDDSEGRHLTDDGNAQRLVDAYGDELRHVEAWGWMTWDGVKWRIDDKNVVMRRARDTVQSIYVEAIAAPNKDRKKKLIRHAEASEAAGRVAAMITLAKSDDRISMVPDDFDADPWLFACRNGVIDLSTGELRPPTRDDHITKFADVEYDPDFRLDRWERFLDDSTRGDQELIRYLRAAVGYTLTGDTREESLFIIHGPAASGKSTFIDGVMCALGEYAMVTQAETFLSRRGQGAPKDELARFYGARMVATVEVPEGERFAEALVKQLTGGDKLSARHLYKSGFEYTPHFKLWFATNHAPRIQDDAIWRRVKKIPFIHSVPAEKRDPLLKMEMKDPELGGKAVLAWAVRGCIDWQQHGLITPKSVREETEDYRIEQDKFGTFLDEECVIKADAEIKKDDVYARYKEWCFTNGEKPMTSTSFTTKIKGRPEGFTAKRRSTGWWYTGLGVKERSSTWEFVDSL
jgi:putative DNA primase/helicase